MMESISAFITQKLKVNREKSAVARPKDVKFLGFSFTGGKEPKRRISPQARERFKQRVRRLKRRSKGVSLERMIEELAQYLRGWIGYFCICETPYVLLDLDSWIRRRLRCFAWKQWRRGTKRFAELRGRGLSIKEAACTAGSHHGPWHLSRTLALGVAFPNTVFDSMGLPSLKSWHDCIISRSAVYGPVRTVV